MNTTQQLKLLGLLRDTKLQDTKAAPIPQNAGGVDVSQPYCGNPVHRDDEIADSDPDTVNACLDLGDREIAEHIIEMHKQTPPDDAEAAGSGSWRAGCQHLSEWYDPEDHAATYFVDRDTFSSNWKRPMRDDEWEDLIKLEVYDEQHGGIWGPLRTVDDCKRALVYRDEEMARDAGASLGGPLDMLDLICVLVEEDYRRRGCAWKRVYTGPEGSHNIHIRGKPMPGSLAGYAYFNNATCGDHVNNFIDNLLGQEFIPSKTLIGHEGGHNNNLQHQFSGQGTHHDPMSYDWNFWSAQGYSDGSPVYRLPKAPSTNVLQRFFDWENHIPAPPGDTVPPTTPPSEHIVLDGELIGEIKDGKPVFRGSVYLKQGQHQDIQVVRDIELIVSHVEGNRYRLEEPFGV